MAKTSKKTKEINDFIDNVFNIKRVDSIEQNLCSICGKSVTEFENDLSHQEYIISGMCQECQDRIFETKRRYDGPQYKRNS